MARHPALLDGPLALRICWSDVCFLPPTSTRFQKLVQMAAAAAAAVRNRRSPLTSLSPQDKDSLKRGDIHSAAKAKGVTWSDSIYQRIMKVTCDNVGNAWALKSGDIS